MALNADKATPPESVFSEGSGLLRSDTDAQLLIVVPFLEKVKIRSVSVSADSKDDMGGAPKIVKLFKNATSLDFADAEDLDPTAELDLSEEDLKGAVKQKLKFTAFQSVDSVTIFIESNQDDEDVSFVNNITFYGKPIVTTNMNELKKSG